MITLLLIFTVQSTSLISSVYHHYSSRTDNTGTIKVSLNHTLPKPLHYSTHKVFKSHVKSSQAEFLYSSVLLKLTACLLVCCTPPAYRYTPASYMLTYSLTHSLTQCRFFGICSLMKTRHGHASQKTYLTWCYALLCDVTVHAPVARTKRKHSFPYCCLCVCRAWPRDDILLLLRVGICLGSCDLAMGIHVTIFTGLYVSYTASVV
jgi:hypothetical protein